MRRGILELDVPGGPLPPKPDRRWALELLASCLQEGCIESTMFAHGFTIEQICELVYRRERDGGDGTRWTTSQTRLKDNPRFPMARTPP
jgi:hypothetical protein